eukprot:TCONS_00050168-protein
MAKFVIAGKSDCPFYARAELLADELTLKLPNFNVHKIVLSPSEWKDWVKSTCSEKGWNYSGQSPIIWRELINRGGKGTLLGSCNDFLEYAKGYYGITCKNPTPDLNIISGENKTTKEQNEEETEQLNAAINPFKIAITSADTDVAYHALPLMIRQDIFGEKQEVSISLHYNDNSENVQEKINGLVMELQDCAELEVREITATSVLKDSFQNADFIVILNTTKEMDRSAVSQLQKIASNLKKCLNNTTKMLVIGENAIICSNIIHYFLNGIQRKNLMAMTRFEENIGKSAVAKVLDVNSAGVKNLILWGSSKEYITDYSIATAQGYNGAIWAPHINKFSHSVSEIIYNKKFLDNELPEKLNDEKLHLTSHKLSFTAAFISQLQDLLSQADKKNEIYSLGVISDGSFGIPDGLIYSFPVKYTKDGLTIQTKITCDQIIAENIKRTAEELQDYCDDAIALVDPSVLKRKESRANKRAKAVPDNLENLTENGTENIPTDTDTKNPTTEPTQEE